MITTKEHATRTSPFMATLLERYSLTKPGSTKTTTHILLDLAGSDISYRVGDSLGIYPEQDPAIVNRILARLGATGDEDVTTAKGKRCTLRTCLTRKSNIDRIGASVVALLANSYQDFAKRDQLLGLLEPERCSELRHYLSQRSLWDLLEEYPGAQINPQELVSLLGPLLPRYYSIASCMEGNGQRAELTVALTRYQTCGHHRLGVASHYLINLAPLGQPCIPTYLQPSKDFTLPEDDTTSIIMVGSGTGVAPFRGFLQERQKREQPGRNWLFFGERNQATDFFYEEEFKNWERQGFLRLETAFSCDQGHKIYVQDCITEHGSEIYDWLQNGAHIYVCGDALTMAKGVDLALQNIFVVYGHLDPSGARAAIRALRKEKRYLRDVY